jgi:hypothetical protein
MYFICKAIKKRYSLETGYYLPHGSIQGYDTSLDNSYSNQFITKEERKFTSKAFKAAFDTSKVSRFGEEIGKGFHSNNFGNKKPQDWKKIEKNRQQMKEYFDIFYYRQPQSTGRSIFLVFGMVFIFILFY